MLLRCYLCDFVSSENGEVQKNNAKVKLNRKKNNGACEIMLVSICQYRLECGIPKNKLNVQNITNLPPTQKSIIYTIYIF